MADVRLFCLHTDARGCSAYHTTADGTHVAPLVMYNMKNELPNYYDLIPIRLVFHRTGPPHAIGKPRVGKTQRRFGEAPPTNRFYTPTQTFVWLEKQMSLTPL